MSKYEDVRIKVAKINDVVKGASWDEPRVQMYIGSTLASLQAALDKVEADLMFERAVNQRVMEVIKGMELTPRVY